MLFSTQAATLREKKGKIPSCFDRPWMKFQVCLCATDFFPEMGILIGNVDSLVPQVFVEIVNM